MYYIKFYEYSFIHTLILISYSLTDLSIGMLILHVYPCSVVLEVHFTVLELRSIQSLPIFCSSLKLWRVMRKLTFDSREAPRTTTIYSP